jgi:hypothetical protein
MKAMSRMPRFYETEGGFCSGIEWSARVDLIIRDIECHAFHSTPDRKGAAQRP